MAGISFGSIGLLFLILLVASAVFVRTEIFQSYLRDQVVGAVQSEIGAQIRYEDADIRIFQFYPELKFTGVELSDQATDVEVQIDKVAVSVNAFVTIPLLFFQIIHISSADIEGLKYSLEDARVIEEWLERLQPQESETLIPSKFVTVIGEINFRDFELNIDLEPSPQFNEALAAKLFLDEFAIEFEDGQILLDGSMSVQDLNFRALNVEEGRLQLDRGRFEGERFSFVRLLVVSKNDRFEASGSIDGFDVPSLDVEVELEATLHQYLEDFPLRGFVKSEFSLEGALSELKGRGAVSVDGVQYQGRRFDQLSANWSLEFPKLQLESFQLRSGEERIDAQGIVGLSENLSSQVDLQIRNLSIGKYVGAFDYGVQNWRGATSGRIGLRGDLLFGGEKSLSADLKVQGFQIRSWQSNNLILSLGEVKASADAVIRSGWGLGQMTGRAETETTSWDVKMNWGPEDFMLSWEGELAGGKIGQLYMFDIQGQGSMNGSYGGKTGKPFRLEVKPRLEQLVLNDQRLNNFRGLLSLEHRRMHAEPIQSDQVELRGGLYFPKGGDVEFSELEFTASGLDLSKILDSFDGTKDWPIQLDGSGNANGVLRGPVDSPTGQGVMGVNNLVVQAEETRGRLFKANWEFVPDLFRMTNIYLETSSESGGVRGDLDLNLDGIQSFDFNGTKLRWADWALLLDSNLPIQSSIDLDISYDRAPDLFKADVRLSETFIGSSLQENSRIRANVYPGNFDIDLDLFNKRLVANLESMSREWSGGPVRLQSFDTIPLIKPLQGSGLEYFVSGEGRCEVQVTEPGDNSPAFERFLQAFSSYRCHLRLEDSVVRRSTTVLHEISAFDLRSRYSPETSFSASTSRIRIQTGPDIVRVDAKVESPADYEFKVVGSTGLESISYFLPFLNRSEGKLFLDGVWDEDGLDGSISLDGGLLLFEGSPILFRDVSAQLVSENSAVNLRSMDARLRDGSLTANGSFQLRGFDVESALISANLNGALIEPKEGINFRSSGPLVLRIVEGDARISGDQSVTEGFFRRRINLRTDLLRAFQPSQPEYQFFEEEESFINSWALDIDLNTTEAFVIRNNLADGEFTFDLELLGTIGQPVIGGSVSLIGGRFNYLNRSFQLESGSVQFQNIPSNIPRYDLRATTEVENYRVSVNFQGNQDEQRIIYSSEPPLTEKEILSLVTYGLPPSSADSEIAEDGTQSAAFAGISFVTGQLQDTIEGALSSDLGIQRFQLYPAFFEATGETELQLTVGTDIIRNRLALNYSNFVSASGGHKVELDLRVNRNVSLIGSWRDLQDENIEQNIGGDLGGDVIFRFEFD